MAERDNNGALFTNDRKEKENHPDYKGSATINGVEYWVSGWIKAPSGKATKKWMSLAFEAKQKLDGQVRTPRPIGKPTGMTDDIDDDIPF